MGQFLAYFPTWIKFHEIHEFGAYIHPFDFIATQYPNDLKVSSHYAIQDTDWESKFAKLQPIDDPVAFLSPAMQEGSTLSGPFLPIDWTLPELHQYMGLGSIWTIGLPFMPSTISKMDSSRPFRLHAFPKQWEDELSVNGCSALGPDLCFDSAMIAPVTDEKVLEQWPSFSSQLYRHGIFTITHIGARLGIKSMASHPGWTSHLPGGQERRCLSQVVSA